MLPTAVTALGSGVSLPLTSQFSGNLAENGAYVGLPLLALLAWWLWSHRRDKWLGVLAFTAIACLVAELGPKLHIGGLVGGYLPWILLSKLPFLKDILPVRFALYFDLTAAIVVAIILARLGRSRMVAAALLAVVVVLPWWPAPWRLTRVVTPSLFAPQTVRRQFPAHETLVVLPYGDEGQSMIWQAADQMYFTMAGGYLSFVPASMADLPVVGELYGTRAPGKDFGGSLLAFCHSHGVRAVVATPGTPPLLLKSLHALKWNRTDWPGATIFWVPKADV